MSLKLYKSLKRILPLKRVEQKMAELTTIQVTKEIKETLNSMKKKGESYEDVLKRLIEEAKRPKMEKTIEAKKANGRELKPVRLIG